MVYAYTRVSTEGQTLENQRYGIKQYCSQHSMSVDLWFEEKISGAKLAKERELNEVLKHLKQGDTLICTEISRIGRSTIDVLETIKQVRERGAVLIAIKQNFILNESLNAKIMGYVFAMVAEIERDLISQRIKEGLAARKAAGVKLGREPGSHNNHHKLEPKREFIEICLKAGKSKYYIRAHLRTNAYTLNNFLVESGLAKEYGLKFSDKFLSEKLRLPITAEARRELSCTSLS